MSTNKIKIEIVKFSSRYDRLKYLVDKFGNFIQGKVLDVGCDKQYLKTLISTIDYTGIDKTRTADLVLDLEKINRLPFDDDFFDCVLCLDVLEHLDNLHIIFDELIRVSKENIFISLPNCWCDARVPIQRGYGKIGHYGLPVHPPPDRHKWFFNTEEAIDFVYNKQKLLKNFYIQGLFIFEKPKVPFVRMLRRLFYYDLKKYLNRYANSVWFFLKKRC